MTRREQLKDAQINEEKANETYIKILSLSYNEVHALQLGLYLGIIVGLVNIHASPFISVLLLFDLAISSIGFSIISSLITTYTPTHAYIYTIRSEPWYYLFTLLIGYVVTVILYKTLILPV